ncbi:hypothetical protein PISL3812_04768 [Talaromyces islandicus]|uniref:Uncharacterized protein n=1 Tax=Talaromyces islandicus TaxID=28573 RepID=A0A0U1LWF9_TALIS|nr:hypothetical protein PISL3812_04768 [Talaromyces islandicus]
MGQPLMYGLAIEANLPNGQLSLHDYRKFLSQSNDIITMDAEPSRRTLKRKPATINLNQAKPQQQVPRHDFVLNLYSPVSSAPSSPPPLSFCQSVVTLHGDLPTPVSPSPLPSSTIRSFSRPSSVARSAASQRIESFSSRLKQAKNESAMSYAHHRASSDSILLGMEDPHTTVTHNGVSFQILNPHKSLENSRIVPPVSSVRSSTQSGLAEMNQENFDHKPTMAREQSLLDSMARPISASESAILSRAPTTRAAPIPTETNSDPSFDALPSIQDAPMSPRSGTPWSPEKTPTRTLRQQVSRFFGSAEKRGDRSSQHSGKSGSSNVSTLHADSHRPSIDARKFIDGDGDEDEGRSIDKGPISPLSLDVPRYLFDEGDFLDFSEENRVSGHGASMSEPSMSGGLRRVSSLNSEMLHLDRAVDQWYDQVVEQHEQQQKEEGPSAALNDEESDSNAVETRPWRRPVYGPHSSNRHQTLHDALSQLNTNRQSGVTYEDITEYLRSQAGEVGYESQSHERIEKPWQPETWAEPRTFAPPLCSRASDGDLSTTAPSTRPSIRPFARQAAAFIAGDGLDSASITSVGTAIDDVGQGDETENGVEYAMEDAMEEPAAQPSASRKSTMHRAISHRARPLSSNPPELDIPVFLAASRSSSKSSLCQNLQSPKADDTATGDGGNIVSSDGSSTSSVNDNASPGAEAPTSATRAPAPAPTVSLSPMTAGTGVSRRLDVSEDSVHGTADPTSKTMSLRGSAALTGARGSGGKMMKKATKRHQQKPKRDAPLLTDAIDDSFWMLLLLSSEF